MLCSLSQTETISDDYSGEHWPLEIPHCYWEHLEVLHGILPSASCEESWGAGWLVFLFLSTSEINLENTLIFRSFRQTLKHMVGHKVSTGFCAWCCRCTVTRDRASFPPKEKWNKALGYTRLPCPVASPYLCSGFLMLITPTDFHSWLTVAITGILFISLIPPHYLNKMRSYRQWRK